ncbi:MAG: insulinase family protein [Hyphomonadaceae bacterium]|jgi:predicted Zn-dependent peptidase|nr:insulinase family protein [Hyphomonadaceae bacterium]
MFDAPTSPHPTARVTTLDNGVRVVTDLMAGLHTASVGVWVDAGTRHETPDQNGAAHLLEHLVFKGAGGRTAQALAEDAESRGIWLNAATSYERTGFHARCIGEDVAFALGLCADLVLAPHLDANDLELERGVVMQEIGEATDDPADRAGVLHQRACFPDQALGLSILGEPDSLAGLNLDDIIAFRERTYASRAMIVGGAGLVDHDALVDFAQTRFGSLPARDPAAAEAARPVAASLVEARDSEQLNLILSIAGLPSGHPSMLALRLMTEILGGGMASRLFQDLRERRGLVYSVEAYAEMFRDTGRLGIAAGCSASQAGQVATSVREHLNAMAETGPTEAELARAKRVFGASMLMAAESPGARAEAAVSQTLVFGAPLTMEGVRQRLAAATVDDVRAIAKQALMEQLPAASAVGPKAGLEAAGAFATV